MKQQMLSRHCLLAVLFLTAACCELTYDPSFSGAAPASPGSEYPSSFHAWETAAPTYTPEDLSKSMPLSKLLDIALYNNPSTRASWSAARAAAFGYRASLSNYYPSITYQGNLTVQRTNGSTAFGSGGGGAVISSDTSTSISSGATSVTSASATNSTTLFDEITASYLLFDFGGRNSLTAAALYTLEQANWQHNLTMQSVMLSVIDAYTTYLGNKALTAADEQNLQDAQVALEAAEKMRNAGLATLTDVLSAQAVVEQMRLNFEQSKGLEKTGFAEMLIALGLSPDAKVSVTDLPNDLPVVEIGGNISALIELAKERRPDIGAAIAAVKEQEALLGVASSAGLPTLTVTGSSTRLRFLKPSNPTIKDKSLSVQWNYPIFQGFYYVNEQKQIQAQIREALANVDVVLSQVSSGVVVNYYAFKTAEASLPASQAALEYSSRAYRGMLNQYKVGTSSILDVLNALSTLSNARAQQALTRSQWAASLSNLAFAVGILEDTAGAWEKAPPLGLYPLKYKENKPS